MPNLTLTQVQKSSSWTNGDDDKNTDQIKASLIKQHGLGYPIMTFSRRKKFLRTSSDQY